MLWMGPNRGSPAGLGKHSWSQHEKKSPVWHWYLQHVRMHVNMHMWLSIYVYTSIQKNCFMHLFIYSTYWSICLFLYVQSWGFPESMFASVFRPNFRICLCLVFYACPHSGQHGSPAPGAPTAAQRRRGWAWRSCWASVGTHRGQWFFPTDRDFSSRWSENSLVPQNSPKNGEILAAFIGMWKFMSSQTPDDTVVYSVKMHAMVLNML